MKEVAINQTSPVVALLPWGELFEDFFDTVNVSIDKFCNEMTGGWLFGYVEALRSAGIRTVIICISSRVDKPVRYTHWDTGATITFLPSAVAHRISRRLMAEPYSSDLDTMFRNRSHLSRSLLQKLWHVAPYLATPMSLLSRELKEQKVDAILCQEYEFARFDACVLLGKLLGKPVLATFQGGAQLSKLERHLRPMSLKASAGLIIASKAERKRVIDTYGLESSKVTEVFNPIDLSLWKRREGKSARNSLGIPSDAEVVVWHGRVVIQQKGLDILLSAWKEVFEQRPNRQLRLMLVGTGPNAEELKALVTRMQVPGILWIDSYINDRQAMAEYLSAADIYVSASRYEGFAVAPVEAMACGLPVVLSDAPGASELLDDGEASGGILVPKEDIDALAAALGDLLDNPERRLYLARQARKRVEACCSYEAVGEKLRRALIGESAVTSDNGNLLVNAVGYKTPRGGV